MNSMNTENTQEAQDIIDNMEDVLGDLNGWSIDNDDVLSSECYEIQELIKRARRQLA